MRVVLDGIAALEALLPRANEDEWAALVESLEHLNYLVGRTKVYQVPAYA